MRARMRVSVRPTASGCGSGSRVREGEGLRAASVCRLPYFLFAPEVELWLVREHPLQAGWGLGEELAVRRGEELPAQGGEHRDQLHERVDRA